MDSSSGNRLSTAVKSSPHSTLWPACGPAGAAWCHPDFPKMIRFRTARVGWWSSSGILDTQRSQSEFLNLGDHEEAYWFASPNFAEGSSLQKLLGGSSMGRQWVQSPRTPSSQDGGPRAPCFFCALGRDRYVPGGHNFMAREAIPGSGFSRTARETLRECAPKA